MAALTSNENLPSVRGLGEIALCVNNLDAMQKFYEEDIGLPLMARDSSCAFFKIQWRHTSSWCRLGGHTLNPAQVSQRDYRSALASVAPLY